MKHIEQVELKDKTVLLRLDLDLPLDFCQRIKDDSLLQRAVSTIHMILEKGGRVVILSSLGRVTEGYFDERYSLKPIAEKLSEILGFDVPLQTLDNFEKNALVIVLENVSFNVGEKFNDIELAKRYASLGDLVVMDAFVSAKNATASTTGLMQYSKEVCVGPLLSAELKALGKIFHSEKPFLAIIGGSSFAHKLEALNKLSDKVDILAVGGVVANVFLTALGHSMGKALIDPLDLEQARNFLEKIKNKKLRLCVPMDFVVAKQLSDRARSSVKLLSEISSDDFVLDIGPKTLEYYHALIKEAHTIVWNGPMGVSELAPFSLGTCKIAELISSSSAYSVVGGEDTVTALQQLKTALCFNHLSNGGGAFLEYFQGI